MKAFWRDIGTMTVVGLAVVGLLCLLGLTSFWAALGGLLVLDAVIVIRMNLPRRPPQVRPLKSLRTRSLFLN